MIRWAILTGEYPPTPGGVSDYTQLVATSLAEAGDEVHVWAPGESNLVSDAGVTVHRLPDHFGLRSLRCLDADLMRLGSRVRILVQWVPHGFGYRSLNVGFCAWFARRAARACDRVEIMVHEPFLWFREGSWRQDAAALVHRLMTIFLLRSVDKVWVSIPAWSDRWRAYTLGRLVPFEWLPIPSNVPVVRDLAGVAAVRTRFSPCGGPLVGHFGTFGKLTADMLKCVLPRLLARRSELSALLIGRGGNAFVAELSREFPNLAERISATGGLEPGAVSAHLQACDVFLQLYPDGASSRRGSLMAGLAHGKPIVTNRDRHTESIWLESGAVRLVENETDAQVQAVEALLEDAAARDQLGATASALYDRRFDLRHTVTALRAVP